MRIVHWIYVLALITASMDIVLVVNLGVTTLRLCEVLLLLVMLAAAAQIIQTRTILWPRGGYALLLWCVLQGVFALRSINPGPSLEFFALMMVPIIGVFAALQLYGRSQRVQPLLKGYLVSFVLIAVFGLIQFAAPILHLGDPFILQWIVHGKLPRINGFSFEPSFYATYMMMGWITLIELRHSKAHIVSGRLWLWLIWIVSIALFLSTSKTAWAVMLLEGTLRLLPVLTGPITRQVRRLARGDLRIPLPKLGTTLKVAAITAILIGAIVTVLATVSQLVSLTIFLAGSGIANAPSHSIDKRSSDLQWTIKVIQEHPLVGVSLGGVAGDIAKLMGDPYTDAAAIKLHWGFPVPVEVFAASGLLGFIPFLWFFVQIIWGESRLARQHPQDERSKWLRALIRALVFEWLCLAADQNLVRMYLWFHIAILVIVAYNLRFSNTIPEFATAWDETALVH